MCGIIGYSSEDVTSNDLGILKKVMIESRIRGKHASGAAWFDGNKICSLVKPIPIDKLVIQQFVEIKLFDKFVNGDWLD